MKHQWLAYVIVGLLSIGAGVAIAGLPNNVPVDATIVPPTTTEPPATTVPTTEVPATTDASETTDAPETTESPETTEPASTEPETTDSVALEIPEPSELVVIVANGAGIAGTAARNVVRLTDLGYVDVSPRDGVETVEVTTIYYAEGFETAAVRMAVDLELLPESVAPLADAPEVLSLPPICSCSPTSASTALADPGSHSRRHGAAELADPRSRQP